MTNDESWMMNVEGWLTSDEWWMTKNDEGRMANDEEWIQMMKDERQILNDEDKVYYMITMITMQYCEWLVNAWIYLRISFLNVQKCWLKSQKIQILSRAFLN